MLVKTNASDNIFFSLSLSLSRSLRDFENRERDGSIDRTTRFKKVCVRSRALWEYRRKIIVDTLSLHCTFEFRNEGASTKLSSRYSVDRDSVEKERHRERERERERRIEVAKVHRIVIYKLSGGTPIH